MPDCFVWVALFEPSMDELDEMAEEFGLHELAVDDARHGHGAQDRGIRRLAVRRPAHGRARRDPTATTSSSPARSTFVGPNYVLTVRHRTHVGFAAVRARRRRPELLKHGAGYVFYAVMDNVVDRYFPVIDALETELETIEEQIFERDAARSTSSRSMR